MLLSASTDTLAPAQTEASSPLAPAKRRIMIVDDNSFFSRCLATLINHENDLMVCTIAASYVQLIKALVDARPQLVLMDVCIGTENGIEIARALRNMKVEVPILLTSSVAEPSQEELQQIGHCGFISKFQKPADFLTQIRNFIP